MKAFQIGMAILAMSAWAGQANASSFTYAVDFGTGLNAVTGQITTTCDTCVLSAADISSWSLSGYSQYSQTPIVVSSTDASAAIVSTGIGFYTSPTGIFFDFSNTNGASPYYTYADFDSANGSIAFNDIAANDTFGRYGAYYVCANSDGTGCSYTPETTDLQLASPVPLPATIELMLAGLAGLLPFGRKRILQAHRVA